MTRAENTLIATPNRGTETGAVSRFRILVDLMALMLISVFAACGTDEQTLSFNLPASTGGTVTLSDLTENGDVVVVWYRGLF